jgi:hypothetical protein
MAALLGADALALLRIFAALAIGLIYMLFDVFNNRNIPTIFAYGTLIFAALMTLLYYPDTTAMIYSGVVAAFILSAGYLLYKIGHVGAADIIELAAISMVLFVQPVPYLINAMQLGLPFIVSVFVATGVAALLMIPLYYLPIAVMRFGRKLYGYIEPANLLKGGVTIVAYAAFIAFVYLLFPGANIAGIAVIVIVAVSSATTIIFEKAITQSMVKLIPVGKFEEGDIIATNLMSDRELKAAQKKIPQFGRLATSKLISIMKSRKIKEKFPVYRNAMPLALPIFAGILISLLAGNLILLVI